jgi:hypothetical protein
LKNANWQKREPDIHCNFLFAIFKRNRSSAGKAGGPDQLSPVYLDHLWPELNH